MQHNSDLGYIVMTSMPVVLLSWREHTERSVWYFASRRRGNGGRPIRRQAKQLKSVNPVHETYGRKKQAWNRDLLRENREHSRMMYAVLVGWACLLAEACRCRQRGCPQNWSEQNEVLLWLR